MPYTFEDADKLANLFGSYIDEPNRPSVNSYSNPTFGNDPRFKDFLGKLNAILPGFSRQGYNPQQFGTTQNPPQYRGIRMLLPESASNIAPTTSEDSYKALSFNRVPQYNDLYQMFLGKMISRGYPIYGGTGQFAGREQGFNPIGFGQR